jgi:hypothetical protein
MTNRQKLDFDELLARLPAESARYLRFLVQLDQGINATVDMLERGTQTHSMFFMAARSRCAMY